MTRSEEVSEPAVWLVNVDSAIAQHLSRVACGLRLKLLLAPALADVPSGAFAVVFCDGTGTAQDELLHAWLSHIDPASTLVWALLAESAPTHWVDRLLQGGVTDVMVVPSSNRMIVHRFRLLLELWQRRRLETRERHALAAASYEHDQILAHLDEGVLLLDRNGTIIEVNAAATEWLVSPRERLLGGPVSGLLAGPWADDPLLDWCEHPLFLPITRAQAAQFDDTHFWRADGEMLPVTCRLVPLEHSPEGRLLLVFSDITVRKAEEALVDQLTRYDAVTGLANGPLMRHFLLKAMARALRNDRLLALLYIDLDDFTCINESFGRKTGNQLLRSVGRRLRGCIRTGDLVSRYHEDTFIIVLDEVRSPEDAARIAEQILLKFNTPHDVGAQIVVHASIGLAFYPSQSIGIDTLLQRAANAAMKVKQQGKNNYQIHGDEEPTRVQRIPSEFH